MAESEWVFDVKDDDFNTKVVERSKATAVVVDFWAEWCPPCRMLTPVLEKAAKQHGGKFLLAKVDVDKAPGLAQDFRISSIPTVIGFYGGQAQGQFRGAVSESQFESFLSRLLPSEADQLVEQAVAENDPVKALGLLAEALRSAPGNSRALAHSARLLLEQGEIVGAREHAQKVGEGTDGFNEARNVLARIEFAEASKALPPVATLESQVKQNPTDAPLRFQLGLALAGAGRFEEALENLVTTVELDRAFGAKDAKALILKIFGVLGQQSELSNRFRGRLSRALY